MPSEQRRLHHEAKKCTHWNRETWGIQQGIKTVKEAIWWLLDEQGDVRLTSNWAQLKERFNEVDLEGKNHHQTVTDYG